MTYDLCRVLLIEDTERIRNEFLQNLSAAEFTVTSVSDGTQALTVLQHEIFDIIMVGIDLSNLDSTELVVNLKSNPELQSAPVVVISTDNATQPIMDCIAAGADDYILYPFDPTLLERRIKITIHR